MYGELPMAAVGESIYDELETKVIFFNHKLKEYLQKPKVPDLKLDLGIDGLKIKGKVEHLHEPGLILYRYAAVRAKDFLLAWIYHLILNSYEQAGLTRNTILAGVDTLNNGNWSGWIFKPVDDAIKNLSQMLDIYWRGLNSPIRFFPESALVYVENLHDPKKDETAALNAAYGKWQGSDREGEHFPGEGKDPYFWRCFRHEENPLNDEFKRLACEVYEPLLACREELG